METDRRVDLAKLEKTLGVPECRPLLEGMKKRMERGEPLVGVMTVTTERDEERSHLAKLTGDSQKRSANVRINLDAVASILRNAGMCDTLEEGVVALCGPIENRRAARAERNSNWAAMFEAAKVRLDGKCDLLVWLEDIRRHGLLRRIPCDNDSQREAILRDAVEVLLRLPVKDVPLPQFATEVLGDSHALDPDREVTGLVLRALAARAGLEGWGDAESRREAWSASGVIPDELSAPVLTLNLRTTGADTTSRHLALLAETGEPTHLTVRQLLRCPPVFENGNGRTVFVCENPAVIAAAAANLKTKCAPMVCISGQPKTASRLLLTQLANAGWTLAYHGDYDWAGIQIANLIISRHNATPWRMMASDYLEALPSAVPLAGIAFSPTWDPSLREAMAKRGYSVLEEQVIDKLLGDLDFDSGGRFTSTYRNPAIRDNEP